jgi:hypothetical protein
MSKYCQSCSIPIEQDPLNGGSEKDGTKSKDYCSNCYENGAFIQPDMTVKDMQALWAAKLKERGLTNFFAWLLTRTIPKLKRWRDLKKNGKT